MADPLRNRGPLGFAKNTNIDLAKRIADEPMVTSGEHFSRMNPGRDFLRGIETASRGINAGAMYRDADLAEAQGNIEDADRLRAMATQIAQDTANTAPRVSSYQDVEGVGDAIDYAQGQLGSAAPTIVPPLIGGATGALAGSVIPGAGTVGGFIGGMAGAAIPAFQLEAGEQAQSQQQDPVIAGMPVDARLHEQNIKALQNAALESIVPGVITGRIFKGVKNAVKIAKAGEKAPGVKGLAKAVGTNSLTEGATEFSQTLTGQASLARLNPNRDPSEDVAELIDSTIAGVLAGGGLSIATGTPGALIGEAKNQGLGTIEGLGRGDRGSIPVDELKGGKPGTPSDRGSIPIDDLKPAPPAAATPEATPPAAPPPPAAPIVRTDENGKPFIDITELDKRKSELDTIPESERVDAATGETGNVLRGYKRPFKIEEQDAYLKNLVKTGQVTESAIDSGTIVPLGDALSQRGAKRSEAITEANNLVRDIEKRLKSSPKSEVLKKELAALKNPGKLSSKKLREALNKYGTLSLEDDPTKGFVVKDEDLPAFRKALDTTGTDTALQQGAEDTAYYYKTTDGKRHKLSSLSTALTMAAKLDLQGNDRYVQGFMEGMAGLLARKDVDSISVKNSDGSFTDLHASTAGKKAPVKGLGISAANAAKAEAKPTNAAAVVNKLIEKVFTGLKVSGPVVGKGQTAKRGGPEFKFDTALETLDRFAEGKLAAKEKPDTNVFQNRKRIKAEAKRTVENFKDIKDPKVRQSKVAKVEAYNKTEKKLLDMVSKDNFGAFASGERTAIDKRMKKALKNGDISQDVYRNYLGMVREDSAADTNTVINKFSKNDALKKALVLKAEGFKAIQRRRDALKERTNMVEAMREHNNIVAKEEASVAANPTAAGKGPVELPIEGSKAGKLENFKVRTPSRTTTAEESENPVQGGPTNYVEAEELIIKQEFEQQQVPIEEDTVLSGRAVRKGGVGAPKFILGANMRKEFQTQFRKRLAMVKDFTPHVYVFGSPNLKKVVSENNNFQLDTKPPSTTTPVTMVMTDVFAKVQLGQTWGTTLNLELQSLLEAGHMLLTPNVTPEQHKNVIQLLEKYGYTAKTRGDNQYLAWVPGAGSNKGKYSIIGNFVEQFRSKLPVRDTVGSAIVEARIKNLTKEIELRQQKIDANRQKGIEPGLFEKGPLKGLHQKLRYYQAHRIAMGEQMTRLKQERETREKSIDRSFMGDVEKVKSAIKKVVPAKFLKRVSVVRSQKNLGSILGHLNITLNGEKIDPNKDYPPKTAIILNDMLKSITTTATLVPNKIADVYQTQINSLRKTRETYNGFLEFNKKNDGSISEGVFRKLRAKIGENPDQWEQPLQESSGDLGYGNEIALKEKLKWLENNKVEIAFGENSYEAIINGTSTIGAYRVKDDKIILFADALENEATTQWVIWHELFHRGISMDVQAKKYKKLLNSMAKDSTVKAISESMFLTRGLYGTPITRELAIEEALAELSAAMRTGNYDYLLTNYGVKVPEGLRPKWEGVVAKFLKAVGEILKKVLHLPANSETTVTQQMVLDFVNRIHFAASQRKDVAKAFASIQIPGLMEQSFENLSRVRGRGSRLTEEEQQALREQIRLERGDDVIVEFMESFELEGASGASFLRQIQTPEGDTLVERVIQVAIDSTDPTGTGFHESLHDFVRELKSLPSGRKLYNKLVKLGNAPHIKAQLKKIISEIPGDQTAALKQLENAEERVAYMYQFWATDQINLTKPATNVFQRLARLITKTLGIISTEQRAEEIMLALKKGKVTKQPDIVKLYTAMQADRNFAAKLADVFPHIQNGVRATYLTATNRLRKTGIPAYNKIADLIYKSPDQEGGAAGQLQRQAQEFGQYKNRFNDILNNHSVEELEVALKNLQDQKDPTSSAEKAMRKLLDDLRDYQVAADVRFLEVEIDDNGKARRTWVPFKVRKNYFVRVWDPTAILDDRAAFTELLRTEGGMSKDEVDQFLYQLEQGDGMVEYGGGPGVSPANRAVNPRKFNFITQENAHKFTKYQEQDLMNIMSTYIRQSTHRTEHTRTWGYDSKILKDLLKQGKEEGASKTEQEMASNAIKAVEGTLGIVPSKLRSLMTGTMTVVNFAVLPLALFSSLVDPLGVAIRTGKMKDAFRAYKIGVKQIVHDIMKSGDIYEQGVNVSKLTRMLGAIDDQAMVSAVGSSFDGVYMSSRLRKWNQKFFNWIGLEGWTQGMRIAAMVAGQHWLLDNKQDAKVLKAMGLNPGDVQEIGPDQIALTEADGLSRLQAKRMQQAMFRFIDGAVLRPTAAQRPIFMSDQRFILLGHLKQFTFSFQNTIVRQSGKKMADAIEEKDVAKMMGVVLPLMSYVPFMIGADILRAAVAGRDDEEDFGGMLLNGVQRSAITGVGTFVFDAADDTRYGGMPISTFLGPTASLGSDLINGAINSDASFTNAAVRAAPGSAAWRGWVD